MRRARGDAPAGETGTPPGGVGDRWGLRPWLGARRLAPDTMRDGRQLRPRKRSTTAQNTAGLSARALRDDRAITPCSQGCAGSAKDARHGLSTERGARPRCVGCCANEALKSPGVAVEGNAAGERSEPLSGERSETIAGRAAVAAQRPRRRGAGSAMLAAVHCGYAHQKTRNRIRNRKAPAFAEEMRESYVSYEVTYKIYTYMCVREPSLPRPSLRACRSSSELSRRGLLHGRPRSTV